MYVDRLGADRARGMNPFAALHAAGVRARVRLRRPGDPARAVGGACAAAVDAPHGGVGRAAGGRARRAHGRRAPGRGGAVHRSRVASCPARPPRTPSGSSGDVAALPAHRPRRAWCCTTPCEPRGRRCAIICAVSTWALLSGVLSLLSQLTLRPVRPAASAAPTRLDHPVITLPICAATPSSSCTPTPTTRRSSPASRCAASPTPGAHGARRRHRG